MRDKLKGAIFGALVAAFATVLLAQTPPPWTAPRTWTTGDLLTAAQFNSNFRDNLLNLRSFAACADSGITGTASADTVLFGDCRWDDIPATTVVALDMGDTTTTASTFQTVGPTASLTATTGQVITLYVSGSATLNSAGTVCSFRLINVSTDTELFISPTLTSNLAVTLASFADMSPSTTSENEYELQLRRVSGGGQVCRWWAAASVALPQSENNRGMIAVVS